jgi:hypothetical protein
LSFNGASGPANAETPKWIFIIFWTIPAHLKGTDFCLP